MRIAGFSAREREASVGTDSLLTAREWAVKRRPVRLLCCMAKREPRQRWCVVIRVTRRLTGSVAEPASMPSQISSCISAATPERAKFGYLEALYLQYGPYEPSTSYTVSPISRESSSGRSVGVSLSPTVVQHPESVPAKPRSP